MTGDDGSAGAEPSAAGAGGGGAEKAVRPTPLGGGSRSGTVAIIAAENR